MTDAPRRKPAPNQRAARLSSELLERAHQVAGIGIYTIDLQRQVIHISAAMARLYRVGEEALELPLAEYRQRFYHPDDRTAAVERAESAYQSGAGLLLGARVVRGDGEIIWVRTSSVVELNEQGESVIVGVGFGHYRHSLRRHGAAPRTAGAGRERSATSTVHPAHAGGRRDVRPRAALLVGERALRLPRTIVDGVRSACLEAYPARVTKLLAPHIEAAAAAGPFLESFQLDQLAALLPQ